MNNFLEDVGSILVYDVTSPSCLRWINDIRNGKVNTGRLLVSAGDMAGTLDTGTGYYRVSIKKSRKQAHRVVWELFNGQTESEIDHINGVRNDNRIENLREVSSSTNHRNQKKREDNVSGVNGVTCCKNSLGKVWSFRAEWKDGESKHSKTFSIAKFGYDEALRLARECREEAIAKINEQGAGYTHDHGKR
jgi:hypothetical protein